MSGYRSRQGAPSLGSGRPAQGRTCQNHHLFRRASLERIRSEEAGVEVGLMKPAATTQDGRVNVLGVGVNVTSLREAVTMVERWICQRAKHYVCITGAHG